jgi:hypothetical protein
VLLDRDGDKLAFEFVANDDGRTRALPPPGDREPSETENA